MGFTNPKVQRLRRLIGRRSSRSEEGAFVVEGPVLLAEAMAGGWTIEGLYAEGDAVADVGPLGGVAMFTLAPGVAARVSDVEAPSGLFAVVARREPEPDALERAAFVVVADRLADPGNLGTIVRSAEAAGADGVVVTPGTVDETNPKVLRASAGAVFHVPVIAATLDAVRGAGLRLVGTSSHRGTPHDTFDWSGRVAIVAGNEAAGLDTATTVDDWVRIEHRGRAESLNVAMATTVLCFEAARQRG